MTKLPECPYRWCIDCGATDDQHAALHYGPLSSFRWHTPDSELMLMDAAINAYSTEDGEGEPRVILVGPEHAAVGELDEAGLRAYAQWLGMWADRLRDAPPGLRVVAS